MTSKERAIIEMRQFKERLVAAHSAREAALETVRKSDEEVKRCNEELVRKVNEIKLLWKADIAAFNQFVEALKIFSKEKEVLGGMEQRVLPVVRRLFNTAFIRSTTQMVMDASNAEKFSRFGTNGMPSVVTGLFGLGLRYNIQSQRIERYDEVRFIIINAEKIIEGLKVIGMTEQAELLRRIAESLGPMRYVLAAPNPEYAVPLVPPRTFTLPGDVMVFVGVKAMLYNPPVLMVEKEGVKHLQSLAFDMNTPVGLLIYDELFRGKESEFFGKFTEAHMQARQWDEKNALETIRKVGGRWLLIDGI